MRKRLVRGLLIVGISAFVGVIALILVASATVERGNDDSPVLWLDGEPTLQALSQRFPRRAANESSRMLEQAALPLGVDLIPRFRRVERAPLVDGAEKFGDVAKSVSNYLNAAIEREYRRPGPPDAKLDAYLERRRDDIDAVHRLLLEQPTPYWELEMDRLFEAPIPNLLGHLNLHRVLLADALAAAAEHDPERAARGLEASWRLRQALADDPIIIVQLIVMSVTRLELGVLRQLREPPAPWTRRLAHLEPRRRLLVALSLEGWSWTQLDAARAFVKNSNAWNKALLAVARPYVRACLADTGSRWRRAVALLGRSGGLCDRSLSEGPVDLSIKIPRWNRVGGLVVPRLDGLARRLARLELDIEFTRKVAALERADELPASFERSRACPADRWLLERDDAGRATGLSFEREVRWEGLLGAGQNLRYYSAPPG